MRWSLGWIGLLLVYAQDPANLPVPYTLADRERLLRVEERLLALEKQLATTNERIDRIEAQIAATNARIDTLIWAVFALAGAVVAGMGGMVAAMFWDRRKTLAPIEKRIEDLQQDRQKLTSLIQSLREYAQNHGELRQILQQHGLV